MPNPSLDLTRHGKRRKPGTRYAVRGIWHMTHGTWRIISAQTYEACLRGQLRSNRRREGACSQPIGVGSPLRGPQLSQSVNASIRQAIGSVRLIIGTLFGRTHHSPA